MSDIRDIWLYANNIIRSARQMVNEDLKPLNLSSAEGNVLLHLLTADGDLRQDEIVGQLDVSKPAVSRALESLEKKAFVLRSKDPSDRRVSRIVLTDQARAIRPELERIYNEALSVATGVMSEQEIEHFIRLFSRVSASFSSARSQRRKS